MRSPITALLDSFKKITSCSHLFNPLYAKYSHLPLKHLMFSLLNPLNKEENHQLLNLTNRMTHVCLIWSFLSSDFEIMLMLIVESQKDAVREKFIRVWEGAEYFSTSYISRIPNPLCINRRYSLSRFHSFFMVLS